MILKGKINRGMPKRRLVGQAVTAETELKSLGLLNREDDLG